LASHTGQSLQRTNIDRGTMPRRDVAAIIVAAGSSSRFHRSKVFASFAGRPLICTTLESSCGRYVRHLALVCRPEDMDRMARALKRCVLPARLDITVVSGGPTRSQSVARGLNALLGKGTDIGDWVLVHDAARPLADSLLVARLLSVRHPGVDAVIPVIPVADSLRHIGVASSEAVDRRDLAAVQTPQLCRIETLLRALGAQGTNSVAFTDEASLIEAAGGQVVTVEGDVRASKVTLPGDARFLEQVYQGSRATVVGFGYDVHRFASGRSLVLGGVGIPDGPGLDGTSDADAVLHALMDAILGCAGAGDIGTMFPASDTQYAGADSAVLLSRVLSDPRVQRIGIVSADVTIVAERPRLGAYQASMRKRIASLLHVGVSRVNVKVTGNDTIGWIGHGEGIAALCVVTALRSYQESKAVR